MSKTASKNNAKSKFQSGREIFAEYIPDYQPLRIDESDQMKLPTPSDAGETIDRLISKFRQNLHVGPAKSDA